MYWIWGDSMIEKDIKPMPKYIRELIKKEDEKHYEKYSGIVRFYAYLAIWHKELVKVTVAVKTRYKNWYCKQVAVHGVHSDRCWLKDIICHYVAGYIVGWHEEGLSKKPKWYENGWGWNDDKYFDPYAPIVNLEVIDKLPEYKYSAYKLYGSERILQYLRIYEKYPQVEYLVKLGLQRLATSKQICEKMKKNPNFCKWLAKNRELLSKQNFYVHVIIRAYNQKADPRTIQAYDEAKRSLTSSTHGKRILELFGNDIKTFLHYIAEQKTNIASYGDYLVACDYLGVDMSDTKNRMPKDFRRWHDIRSDEYKTAKAMRDAEKRREFYEKFAVVAEKYIALQHDKKKAYICIIAKSPQDLVKEGDALDHCVGRMGYDQKMVREESLIFFIRSKESPDVPLVTVEYSVKNKKILQCYGYHDTKPEPAILDYVQKTWLPYANRTIKKIA